MSWAPNPRVGGSILGLDLAVVMLSKSLYPHCSSITNYKIRDLASAKEGKNISPIYSAKNLVGLWVPTPHQWYYQYVSASF